MWLDIMSLGKPKNRKDLFDRSFAELWKKSIESDSMNYDGSHNDQIEELSIVIFWQENDEGEEVENENYIETEGWWDDCLIEEYYDMIIEHDRQRKKEKERYNAMNIFHKILYNLRRRISWWWAYQHQYDKFIDKEYLIKNWNRELSINSYGNARPYPSSSGELRFRGECLVQYCMEDNTLSQADVEKIMMILYWYHLPEQAAQAGHVLLAIAEQYIATHHLQEVKNNKKKGYPDWTKELLAHCLYACAKRYLYRWTRGYYIYRWY